MFLAAIQLREYKCCATCCANVSCNFILISNRKVFCSHCKARFNISNSKFYILVHSLFCESKIKIWVESSDSCIKRSQRKVFTYMKIFRVLNKAFYIFFMLREAEHVKYFSQLYIIRFCYSFNSVFVCAVSWGLCFVQPFTTWLKALWKSVGLNVFLLHTFSALLSSL